MVPLLIADVGAICKAVADIRVGGAAVADEEWIGKAEGREEGRILGWKDACAQVASEGWGRREG